MNEDAYAECLVKRKDPAYAFPAKAGITVLLVIALLTAFVSLLGLVLLAAVGVAAYFVHTGLSVEYEYLFVEGDLSIDRILAKSRRKKVLECRKDEIQIVAPSDSYMLKDYEKKRHEGEGLLLRHRGEDLQPDLPAGSGLCEGDF